MRVMDKLSGEELADRSGVTAEQLRRLVELGIITPTPQGCYRPSDIQRIRVVDTLADAGFAPEPWEDGVLVPGANAKVAVQRDRRGAAERQGTLPAALAKHQGDVQVEVEVGDLKAGDLAAPGRRCRSGR
jgi:hypothetical protein